MCGVARVHIYCISLWAVPDLPHYFVGAGNQWGATYSYAMCYWEEQMWIRQIAAPSKMLDAAIAISFRCFSTPTGSDGLIMYYIARPADTLQHRRSFRTGEILQGGGGYQRF